MKIWLDDLRNPPDDTWEVCRSDKDFLRSILLCAIFGHRPEVISFDHDLGPDSVDGYVCLKRIVEVHPDIYPLEVRVHSANPVGAENIRAFDACWRREHPETG